MKERLIGERNHLSTGPQWVERRPRPLMSAMGGGRTLRLRDFHDCRSLDGKGELRLASVFLSYARDDSTKASRLAEILQAAGHDVWWDERIDAGAAFSAEIENALRKADLVLV